MMRRYSFNSRVIWAASLFITLFLYVWVIPPIASSQEDLKIGVPTAISGPKAFQGEYLKLGITMAAKDINDKGGILGRKIKLFYADTESKVEVGVSAYEKLITREKVDFIVGELDSHVALGTMDVVAKYGIPTIYVIPASNVIGEKVASNPDKFKNIFMTDTPASAIWDGAFYFLEDIMKESKWKPRTKTAALIAANAPYPLSVIKTWRERLSKMGWEVVVDELVPFEATEFTPVLTKVASKKPAMIKIELPSTPAGISITKQMNEFGIDKWALIWAGYYQKTVEFRKAIGALAEGSLNVREPYPAWWGEHLKKLYPDADPIQCMWGYDGMNVMATAIKNAGSFDYKKVIDALLKLDYKGLFMRTVFDPVTHFPKVGPNYKVYGVGQFQNGNLQLLWPKDWAQTQFKSPFK